MELGRAVRHTAKQYAATHDASLVWEGHKAGRHIGYRHLEKLHNLEALPATGFTICLFPGANSGGSGGMDARGRDPRLKVHGQGR